MPLQDAFGGHAGEYERLWSNAPLARIQRERVWALIDTFVNNGARFLDLGCGIGDDVVLALERGHRVVAVDKSEGMLDTLRERLPAASVYIGDARRLTILENAAPFDVALLNFGVINCVERPAEVARALARHVRPGGWAFVVWMPRWSWGEVAYFGLRGHFRAASRRWSGHSAVEVAGREVPTWFHTQADVCADFLPWFTAERCESLSVVLPPPRQTARWTRRMRWLERIDGQVRALPVLSATGDHAIVAFRRRAAAMR